MNSELKDRVAFNMNELLQAMEEDSIVAMVYRMLRPKYGNSLVFHTLVSDVSRSVRLALIQVIRDHLKYDVLNALINQVTVAESEARVREQIKNEPVYEPRWIGEGSTAVNMIR